MASLSPTRPNSRSPFSLTKQNDDTTDDDIHQNHSAEEEELTTSGRTYQELVEQLGRGSELTHESAENEHEYIRRKSVGCFLSGRNSISNWTNYSNNEATMESLDVPANVEGKEVRVSGLDSPRDFSGVNVSSRNSSRVNSRQKSNAGRRSTLGNNLSHISSSSSSAGDDLLGESWSPIRSDFDNSNVLSSPKRSLSKSPLKSVKSPRSAKSPKPRMSRSKSPKPTSGRSPTRSPLADVSPNRASGRSPKKSPLKCPMSTFKEALSPNGTYSLKEAEGVQTEQAPDKLKPKLTLPSLKPAKAFTFSPEKPTGFHARSPAPTPNSQRREMKRLRASLPTANYMDQDDLMEQEEEDQVANSIKLQDKLPSVVEQTKLPASEKAPALPTIEYKNDFVFPDIPEPLTETVALFHNDAVAKGANSHQYQLNAAGTGLMSIQEVLLPAIAYDTNNVLKKLQSKAQRNAKDGMPDHQGKDVVEAIEICRKVVQKCTSATVEAAGKSWRDQEEKRLEAHLKLHAEEMEQQKQLRAQAKIKRKQERALKRQQNYERQKYEKQKSHPRNKEMWQEVAKLMMEIQKLEKEERLWNEALAEVKAMEKNFQSPQKMDLASLDDSKSSRAQQQEALCKSVESTDLEAKSTTLVQDVTMATERISWMLQSVSLAMEESDRLRQEAYTKYQHDGHKYYGYETDSKGLFVALSMDDSFAG